LENFGDILKQYEMEISKITKSKNFVGEIKDSAFDFPMEERDSCTAIDSQTTQVKEEKLSPPSIPVKMLKETTLQKPFESTLENLDVPMEETLKIKQETPSPSLPPKTLEFTPTVKKEEFIVHFKETIPSQQTMIPFTKQEEIKKPKKTVKFSQNLFTLHHFQLEIEEENFKRKRLEPCMETNKKMKLFNPLDSFLNLDKRFIPIWKGDICNLDEKIETIEIFGDSQDYHQRTLENISKCLHEIKQFNIRYTVEMKQFQCKSEDVVLEISTNSKSIKKASERLISKKKAFVFPWDGFEVFFFPQESYSNLKNIFQRSEKLVAIFRRK
jgi:hypothetical protein